jgi:8-oxo-dGTP pyrophosphatase MutT (NUDIX family)
LERRIGREKKVVCGKRKAARTGRVLKKKMFSAGGLLPWRRREDGKVEFLLLRECRYKKDVLHVAGGKVEAFDTGIRDTIYREFVEEVGNWPDDLCTRVQSASLTCPAHKYCLALVDVSDVREQPPENTEWVASAAVPSRPMTWLATRCVERGTPSRFGRCRA